MTFRWTTVFTTSTLLLLASTTSRADEVPGSELLDRILDRVEVLPASEHRAIAIFPLALKSQDGEKAKDDAEQKPSPIAAGVTIARDATVRFREPRWPSRRWNVEAVSRAEHPVLVLGGSLLYGGRLDRMVLEDVLIPPGATVELEALPAEYPRDARKLDDKEARWLRLSDDRAPTYLRKHAVFDADRDLVPTFVSHFLGFRAEDDRRNSLRAIGESPILERTMRSYVDALGNVPGRSDVVGWVTVVAGRIHDVALFGSNELARGSYLAHLRAHTFPATAWSLRAEEFGLEPPEPGGEDESPERFRPAVDDFLAMLRTAERRCGNKPSGTLGASCLLRKDRVWGEALALEGRLVHAGAVADLPFHERLYRRPIPPPAGEEWDAGFGALDRESSTSGGRLTEFEKRLLDRMRERRGR